MTMAEATESAPTARASRVWTRDVAVRALIVVLVLAAALVLAYLRAD